MIITELIIINNKEFTKNYSDAGYKIQKVGTEEVYSEAMDPINSGRTYVETMELIEEEEAEITSDEFLAMVQEVL